MRRVFIFITVAIICLVTSCATSGKAALLEQNDPIALVSVISNRDVNWKGEEPTNPDAMGFVVDRRLRRDPDMTAITEADELINQAEVIFRETISTSPLINLADRETVLQSHAYQDAKERNFPNRNVVKPYAHRFINFKDKDFPAALAAETGLQRSMFVEFNLTKSLYSGVSFAGSCRAEVDMTVIVLDAKGKIIYRKTISLPGRVPVKTSSGVYSQSEFISAVQEAITDICYEFVDIISY